MRQLWVGYSCLPEPSWGSKHALIQGGQSQYTKLIDYLGENIKSGWFYSIFFFYLWEYTESTQVCRFQEKWILFELKWCELHCSDIWTNPGSFIYRYRDSRLCFWHLVRRSWRSALHTRAALQRVINTGEVERLSGCMAGESHGAPAPGPGCSAHWICRIFTHRCFRWRHTD